MGRFAQGKFSLKNAEKYIGTKTPTYRSSWEFAFMNGKQRVELIEVKPENQTIKEKVGRSRHNQAHWIVNQAKWEAARAYCKQKGIFFRIVTENDIFHNGKRR